MDQIRKLLISTVVFLCVLSITPYSVQGAGKSKGKQKVHALYIPLADHYAGIVAYEKYRDKMTKADYQIERMPNWNELRAYFMSGEVDMAFIEAPMAMDMFLEDPMFRWVGLMHRDGNALAINDLIKADVSLSEKRIDRKPTPEVANAFAKARAKSGKPVKVGVPSLLSTHTVVLYRYMKENGKSLGIGYGPDKDLVAIAVPPSKSPAFLKRNNARGIAAAFEQSLPWADVVETQGFGHVAWYSKDIMPWPKGHVECITVATDKAIAEKNEAIKEVIYYIHKAGQDIETAKNKGGNDLIRIADMIRKHIPEHNEEAIIQSLRPDLNVINYNALNIDKAGLKLIMDYAVEGSILKEGIDIQAFSDDSFRTDITEADIGKFALDYTGEADKITETMRANLNVHIEHAEQMAASPMIIEEVRKQNARKMSLKDIRALDKEWIEGGQLEFAKSLQTNKAGSYLQKTISAHKKEHTEAFLCDSQGAVVGEYPKTSDYWQGDEKKFTESYNNGKGRTYVGPLSYDESTRAFSVQISVPVKDAGETIGVLILGLRNVK